MLVQLPSKHRVACPDKRTGAEIGARHGEQRIGTVRPIWHSMVVYSHIYQRNEARMGWLIRRRSACGTTENFLCRLPVPAEQLPKGWLSSTRQRSSYRVGGDLCTSAERRPEGRRRTAVAAAYGIRLTGASYSGPVGIEKRLRVRRRPSQNVCRQSDAVMPIIVVIGLPGSEGIYRGRSGSLRLSLRPLSHSAFSSKGTS